MDGLVKNGESSSSVHAGMPAAAAYPNPGSSAPMGVKTESAHLNGDLEASQKGTGLRRNLVIPHEWNFYPPLPLHPSMDMLSLTNLRPQFDRFVRPYLPPHILQPDVYPPPAKDDAEAEQQDVGGTGKKKKKKNANQRRMEKGYEGLIEECIDPTPLAPSDSLRSLLYGPPALEIQNIEVKPFEGEAWRAACRLDVGRSRGYGGGEKEGVEAAEAKRKQKKLKKSASLQPGALPSGSSPAPGSPFSPHPPSAGVAQLPNTPREGLLRINLKTPGTPGAVVQQPTGTKRARSQSRGPSASRGTSPAADGRREGSAGPPNKRGPMPKPTSRP